jgi:hypothetical protein
LRLFMALVITLTLSSGVKAQSTSDVVGTWTCPNFTVTIRAERSGYLLHATPTPNRGLREYNLFGRFNDGRMEHTNSQIESISYVSSTKQLIFDGETCTR